MSPVVSSMWFRNRSVPCPAESKASCAVSTISSLFLVPDAWLRNSLSLEVLEVFVGSFFVFFFEVSGEQYSLEQGSWFIRR